MTRTYSLRTSWLLAAALVAAPLTQLLSRPAVAQDIKPIAVISLTGADELLADIGYMTEAAGVGDFGRFAMLMATPYVQPLDKTKPAGFYLTMGDRPDDLQPVLFLPVKNKDALLALLTEQAGEGEDEGNGVTSYSLTPGNSLYVKSQGEWMFASNLKRNMKGLPANPAKLLGDLGKNYTLAVKLNVRNIPAELRAFGLQQMKEGFQEGLEEELDVDQAELAKAFQENSLKQMEMIFEGAESVTLGWNIDAKNKKTYLDVILRGVEGTEMAKQLATVQEGPTDFAGFLAPGSSMNLHFQAKATAEQAKQQKTMIDLLGQAAKEGLDEDNELSDDEKTELKGVLDELLDVLGSSLASGKTDGGAALFLDSGKTSLNFIAGGRIAKGAKLEKAVQKLAKVLKEKEPDFPDFKFNKATYRGVRLHTASVPLNTSEEAAQKMLGDPLGVVLGVSDDSLYVAFGKDAEATLKKVVDDSAKNRGQKVAPSQMNISLKPILQFVAAMDDNPAVDAVIRSLEDGQDRVRAYSIPAENGAISRLELQEGVLKAIGEAAQGLAPLLGGGL